MSLLVFSAVLVAAVLHAIWNGLVKGASDKALNMTAVVVGHAPAAILAVMLAPAPEPASYPYIAAGAALHVGYQFFLLWAYRAGDLTQVYPIARGSAPLVVALISVSFLGVVLTAVQGLAIAIIAVGLFSLALVRRDEGRVNVKAAGLALATGFFIAAYSLVDGLGARVAGTSFGYFGWLALINAVIFSGSMALYKPGVFARLSTEGRHTFLIGGGASFAAYALVTWAFTQAPIALVSALRETSIVFALLIGVVFLREKLSLAKVFSVFTTLVGAVLLRFAKS